MKSLLKSLFAGIAIAAVPAYFAYSQAISTTSNSAPFIPLFVYTQGNATTTTVTTGIPAMAGAASTTATGASATWFIDVAHSRIVMCSSPNVASTAEIQGLTCTAQALPA